MELHEIYRVLLRRGMPEHPRCGCCQDLGSITLRCKVKCSDCAKTEGVALLFDRDDARDLFTMHALRWVNGGTLRLRNGVASDGLNANESLTLILKLTAHLEPNQRSRNAQQ